MSVLENFFKNRFFSLKLNIKVSEILFNKEIAFIMFAEYNTGIFADLIQ
jgi:hypothetical protein